MCMCRKCRSFFYTFQAIPVPKGRESGGGGGGCGVEEEAEEGGGKE